MSILSSASQRRGFEGQQSHEQHWKMEVTAPPMELARLEIILLQPDIHQLS